ncbi:hypothetical protein [Caballeronia pedi]|uniref:hypothetical protein n=1 Tax=Caballeronia pedi TaxID=1777141 RepID=UPI0007727BDA|nr:hypothetical protein [Caballeronia pedi]
MYVMNTGAANVIGQPRMRVSIDMIASVGRSLLRKRTFERAIERQVERLRLAEASRLPKIPLRAM